MRDDNFEREFDAALAKYGAVKPRAGLEPRVLANLRAESAREARLSWRRPILTAAGCIVMWAIFAIWHGGHYSVPKVKERPELVGNPANNDTTPVAPASAKRKLKSRSENFKAQQVRSYSGHGLARYETRLAKATVPVSINGAPRLEQFPAPEPLSEQEKLLVRYVEEDPQEAALVAEASIDQLQREADEMKALGSNTDSEQQER